MVVSLSLHVSQSEVTLFLQLDVNLFIFRSFAAGSCKLFPVATQARVILISELDFLHVKLHCRIGSVLRFVFIVFSLDEIKDLS